MITDARTIKFSNEVLRPQTDYMAKVYYNARIFLDQWTALGLGASIPNDTTILADAAQSGDGRTVIVGADMWAVFNDATTVVNAFEASGKAMLNRSLKVAVNTRP